VARCGEEARFRFVDSVLRRPTLAAGESVELVVDLHHSHGSYPCAIMALGVQVREPDRARACDEVGVWTATSPPAEAGSR
jgi:hypothetical protein